MKKSTLILFLFIPFLSWAQNGITFQIEELSKPEKLLSAKPLDTIYWHRVFSDSQLSHEDVIFKKVKLDHDIANILKMSDAPDSLVSFGANPFFYGMYSAYADHRPFVLSPDMIWLLISQGFSRHVNANPEAMRRHFVDFSGKMSLIAKAAQAYDDPNLPWEEVVSQFSQQIESNVGNDIYDLFSCNFSTSTPVERIASEITLMDAVKPYFEFVVMRIVCGIPEITLQGTPEDWKKLYDKAQQLKKYELDWWISELEPLLQEFIHASEGNVDKAFWLNIFKYHTPQAYGARDIIDGWMVKFFPYDKKGKRNNLKELSLGADLPEEMVKVDVKFVDTYTDTETTLEFWAGFIGLEQNNDNFALTPKIGWMIRKKDAEKSAVMQKLQAEAKAEESRQGISIRVKEVPEILYELEEINHLRIQFIDSIQIPDRLATIRIKNLHLSGEITEKEKERIVNLFPNTELRINKETFKPE